MMVLRFRKQRPDGLPTRQCRQQHLLCLGQGQPEGLRWFQIETLQEKLLQLVVYGAPYAEPETFPLCWCGNSWIDWGHGEQEAWVPIVVGGGWCVPVAGWCWRFCNYSFGCTCRTTSPPEEASSAPASAGWSTWCGSILLVLSYADINILCFSFQSFFKEGSQQSFSRNIFSVLQLQHSIFLLAAVVFLFVSALFRLQQIRQPTLHAQGFED